VLRGLFRRKIIVVALAGVVGAGVMVGIAYAYWTVTGSGTGSATTGSGTALTVNQTVAPTGLYPGGSAALSGNFDNHNAGPVYVTAVTASVTPFTAQADVNKPACTQADFSITGTANVAAEVAAGNGVGAWSGLSLAMADRGTNQDNCKNVTVPVTYAIS
jgi:hypothetical protein